MEKPTGAKRTCWGVGCLNVAKAGAGTFTSSAAASVSRRVRTQRGAASGNESL